MYTHVKPIPLSREQIERIQLAGRIIEREREMERAVLLDAVLWLDKEIPDIEFTRSIFAYDEFKYRHSALPI